MKEKGKRKQEWMHDTVAYHPLAVALAKVMLSEIKVNGKPLLAIRENEGGGFMRSITVEMEYIGGCLSENKFRGRRRDGMLYVRRETRDWQEQLGWLIKTSHIEDWALPLTVKCDGWFKNTHRQPDLSNLSKVILDAIEETTGVNDRDMRWQDGEVSYGEPAVLQITITEGGKANEVNNT